MAKGKYIRTPEIKAKLSESSKNRKRTPFTEEARKKMSEAKKGEKNPNKKLENRIKLSESMRGEKGNNWQGGKTPLHQTIRRSLEYRLWRESVFKRDNYTCVWCGAKNGGGKSVVLNADHIKPFAYFPELRFAIDNGRTLCVPCHKTTDSYLKELKQLI